MERGLQTQVVALSKVYYRYHARKHQSAQPFDAKLSNHLGIQSLFFRSCYVLIAACISSARLWNNVATGIPGSLRPKLW